MASTPELRTRLDEAEAALQALMMGRREISVVYEGKIGDLHKSQHGRSSRLYRRAQIQDWHRRSAPARREVLI